MSSSFEHAIQSILPPDEDRRLDALHRYDILDTPPEEQFDRVARLAARWLEVPIALVTLLAEDRQWFKACIGVEQRETERNVAFCRYNLDGKEMLVVEDASKDPRFNDNPLVTGAPGIRFYAGAPLVAPGGQVVGSLCVIDTKPRDAAAMDLPSLVDLAAVVVDELELRLANRKVRNLTRSLMQTEETERRRLSRLLHENLRQVLHATRMQAQGVDATAALPPEQNERLRKLEAQINEAISVTEGLASRFAPPVGNQSLRDTLDWLALKMKEDYGLTVTVEARDPADVLDETTKTLLFRVVRELLFRVVRRAEATGVRVVVKEARGSLRIIVEENGPGDGTTEQWDDPPGLASVRDRLEAMGGHLHVSTPPGGGTRISIEAPREKSGPPVWEGGPPYESNY